MSQVYLNSGISMGGKDKGFWPALNFSWSRLIGEFWQSPIVRGILAIRILSLLHVTLRARRQTLRMMAHPITQIFAVVVFLASRLYSPRAERDLRWNTFIEQCRKDAKACSDDSDKLTTTSNAAAAKGKVSGYKPARCAGGSVCFRGSGLLLIYHIGVAQYLQDTFDLRETCISGTSGGAIVAGLLAAGVPMSAAVTLYKDMANLSQSSATGPFFTGLPLLLGKLKAMLPGDQAVAARCSNRLRLALTAVPFMEVRLLDQFPTAELLANAIIGSMNLPLFMCPVPPINGESFIDGALTQPGEAPKFDEHTVTISPTTTEADIYPQPLPSKYHFVIPGDDHYQKQLFVQGYEDAKAKHAFWLSRGFKPIGRVREWVQAEQLVNV